MSEITINYSKIKIDLPYYKSTSVNFYNSSILIISMFSISHITKLIGHQSSLMNIEVSYIAMMMSVNPIINITNFY